MPHTEVDLAGLLIDSDARVREELKSTPDVTDVGHDLDVSRLPIEARRWHKARDVVAVVADLKSSTTLGTGKWAASTASIYEAATGNIARILDSFDADFMQIQGDGIVAVFWGSERFERAICSAITIRTFSEALVDRLEAKWPDLKDVTGYKVGVASGRVLVKNVGVPRNPANQEPIWAGKPVNFATKAAQVADRHEVVVTGSVWDVVERNDYLAFSCSCKGPASQSIWKDKDIDRLPDNEPERSGRRLVAKWCETCGPAFCAAVLAGETRRDDADEVRIEVSKAEFHNALRDKARRERLARRQRREGLL